MDYDTVWEFKTARFRVALEILPEELDPADSFEFQERIIDAVRNGEVEWFCARVSIYLDGELIARDTLGGCAYKSVQEFYTSHRDTDPLNRNSTIMRQARGSNVAICHYFPSMVSQVCVQAREAICNRPKLRCAS